MTVALRIPASICEQLLQHAIDAAPEECCGLLLGHPGEIIEAVAARNVAADRERQYQLDPAAHFAAIRRARSARIEVIGAYHSHPRGHAVPSETDLSEAFEDPAFVHVLLAPQRREIAAYSLMKGTFVAVPLARY